MQFIYQAWRNCGVRGEYMLGAEGRKIGCCAMFGGKGFAGA